jgi:hypothetical protein
MSLIRNVSGVLPLAVPHLPQTTDVASADQTATGSPARPAGRLRTIIAAIAVSSVVLAIMAALIFALSVSGSSH